VECFFLPARWGTEVAYRPTSDGTEDEAMPFGKRPSMQRVVGAIALMLSAGIWIIDQASRLEFIGSHYEWLRIAAAKTAPIVREVSWPVLLIIGILFIYSDIRRARALTTRAQIAQQAAASGKELRAQITKWLADVCAEPALNVHQAFLFGSVVHDYPISDVDLIVEFKSVSDRGLRALVRKIKGKICEEFELTFRHKLHVTFFCHDEVISRIKFIEKAGKHELIARNH
jgi:predicted nucleotidyltransferase